MFFPTGTLETAIHFVIYEHLKKVFAANRQRELDLTECMFAAAAAKMTASSLCYPHGEFKKRCFFFRSWLLGKTNKDVALVFRKISLSLLLVHIVMFWL